MILRTDDAVFAISFKALRAPTEWFLREVGNDA